VAGAAVRIATLFLIGGLASSTQTRKVSASVLPAPAAPVNVRLVASPQLVDVGDSITFSLTASTWPAPASVSLSFVSAHHGFTGTMPWDPPCGCFDVAVSLATRTHGVEQGQATAKVSYKQSTFSVRTTFYIRGLASSGHGLAPGGAPHLSVWVSDPTPPPGEKDNFCAWVRTADGLGVSGIPVRFQVHFQEGTRKWNAGYTPPSGLRCVRRSIGAVAAGQTVRVVVKAGTLRASTSFTTREPARSGLSL